MYLQFSGVKAGHYRYNPEVTTELANVCGSATCLYDLFAGIHKLYGMPLKQIAEVSSYHPVSGVPVRVQWVNKTKLYRIDLALSDTGVWTVLGKRLTLSADLLAKLKSFYDVLHSNETYTYERYFVSKRDYFLSSGRHIQSLTLSKIRLLPNLANEILGGFEEDDDATTTTDAGTDNEPV